MSGRRRLAAFVLLAAVFGGAGWYGYHWLTVGRFTVSTDDAYVQAYNATLAAKVAGYLSDVRVTDKTVTQSSDSSFHCLTIILFYESTASRA